MDQGLNAPLHYAFILVAGLWLKWKPMILTWYLTLQIQSVYCVHTQCVCLPSYGKSSASFQLPTTFLSSLAKNTGLPLKEEKPQFLIHNGGSLRESKHQSLALLIRASHSGTWQREGDGTLREQLERKCWSFHHTWSCKDVRMELLQLPSHHRSFE